MGAGVIKWMTGRRFSFLGACVIAWAATHLNSGRYVAFAVVIVVGSLVSVLAEKIRDKP